MSPAPASASAVAPGHVYSPHESVSVVVNKVGPFANPHETYRYYDLPYCKRTVEFTSGLEGAAEEGGDGVEGNPNGDGVDHADRADHAAVLGAVKQKMSMGNALAGDRHETSPYDITFGDPVPFRTLCELELHPKQVQRFKEAVHDDYYFELLVEDLPMWGYVGAIEGEDLILGELEDSKTYLFPHLHFKLGVNENKIVSAHVYTQTHRKVDITDPTEPVNVAFSYSVEWVDEPNLQHKDRMSRYVDGAFLPDKLEIHWLSIINSFILVLLLTTFLSVILMRVLKQDFSSLVDMDEEAGVDEDEVGWKLLHGDV
jgi:hypothetical protein